jgi:uncharacterized membrane protein YidH (DUF202 family)
MGSDPLFIIIVLICFAVVVILALGLGNFARGGRDSGQRSNKMMRYRIIAQAVAVALIVLYVVLRGGWGGGN